MVEEFKSTPDNQNIDVLEQTEKVEVAQEKFERLMNLDHYGVRFVNKDEYEAIFNGTGKIGKEAYWV